MANYSASQLNGDGVIVEAFSTQKTFTLTTPSSLSGSAYFTLETVRNEDGFYDSTSPTNAIGTFSNLSNVQTLVTSSYIFSVVVEQGGGSFTFTPSSPILANSAIVRATGGISLSIT